MGSKRRNEHGQLAKDEYESLMERGEGENPRSQMPGTSTSASASDLAQRRIWQSTSRGGTLWNDANSTNDGSNSRSHGGSSSSNVFSGINLVANPKRTVDFSTILTRPDNSHGTGPAAPASHTSVPTTTNSSFTASAKNTPNNHMAPTVQSTLGDPPTPAPTSTSRLGSDTLVEEELTFWKDKRKSLDEMHVSQIKGSALDADLLYSMISYEILRGKILNEMAHLQSKTPATTAVTAVGTTTVVTDETVRNHTASTRSSHTVTTPLQPAPNVSTNDKVNDNDINQSSTMTATATPTIAFSFARTAPAPPPPTTTTTTTTTPKIPHTLAASTDSSSTRIQSFGGVSSSAPGFGQPPAPFGITSAVNNNNNNIVTTAEGDDNDDGPMPAEPTAEVLAVVDPHWNDVAVIEPVTFLRTGADGSWSTFCTKAKLRLQKGKEKDGSYRMVVRDDLIGKVQVNMAIQPHQKFEYAVQQSSRGSAFGKITFKGCNNVDDGYQTFAIKASVDVARNLHERLDDLAQQAHR